MKNFFVKPTKQKIENFHLKYKPYHIKDFPLDDKLYQVIQSFLQLDDLNLLICGPLCCGKTSLLYAIMRDYYGLKKLDPFPENNILLINNLKDQGINFYRNEMKTFCQSRCSIYGKKKLIIIDDIDMISDQCQQVFRNYIDKYKNNVHFLSVCTTLEKVIESIQSRLHIVYMKMPDQKTTYNIMDNIIVKENLQLDEKAKKYIVKYSNYQVREVLNYLEKLLILKKDEEEITEEQCKQCVSCISFHEFEKYLKYLRKGDTHKAIHILYQIYDYGYSVIDIFDFFFHFIKITPLLEEQEKYLILPSLCKYITYFHSIHENVIEIILFTRELEKIIKK
tara:strand:+ start:3515 stop:4522 length:1008 start_codon:yes stop_codon:yes gene_type:complete